MMKKILIVWSWMMLIGLAACSDWVDVNPKTEVEADDFFRTEDGFKSALIGVYARMTNTETYGADMTFAYIEQLAQRYDNYSASNAPTDEERAKIYDYSNDASSKGKLESIWENMYKNIANINNLLKNLGTNGDVIVTEGYRDLIEGEALALRAFHYFDLLRLWGPVYSLNPTVKSVPWRDQFTSEKVPLMAANELVEKILGDLTTAERLLKNDQADWGRNANELFIGDRKHRMNKYAVKALLARVYLYIGNKEKAAEYAREVIDGCGLKLARDNRSDVSMFEETLFALGMYNMEEKLSSYWKNSTTLNSELWISPANARTVFEINEGIGLNDIRYRNNYGFLHGLNSVISRKYLGEDTQYKEKVPLIRLVEMYYILAESVSLEESVTYINTVRNTRGISRSHDIQFTSDYTDASRVAALEKEYQKEFFAEGQFFYFLKRHNRATFYRCPVDVMRYYVLPIPNDEVEYGNVTE